MNRNRKLFFVDTSVLLYDKEAIHSFKGNDIYNPYTGAQTGAIKMYALGGNNTTGIAVDNKACVLYASTISRFFYGAGMGNLENYAVNVGGESGAIAPKTTST